MPAGSGEQIAHFGNLLLFLLLLSCALAVSGAYAPAFPYLGFAGTMLLTRYTPWFVVVPLVIACLELGFWHKRRKRSALVFCAAASITALGAGNILGRMAAVCHANGVNIDMLRAFDVRSIDEQVKPDAVVGYGSDERGPLELAVYRPRFKNGVRNDARSAPVLMYVHGGGWISGSKLQHDSEMRWFAEQGWLVVSVDYRLSNAQLHGWDRSTGEIGCAMAWVGANAAAYGGDAERFSMTGDSSGGNLAVNAAYEGNRGSLESDCKDKTWQAIPHVSAVIAEYPVLDAASFFTNKDRMFGNVVRAMAVAYTGGTPAQFPERYAAIASRAHISGAAPPTLILAAESDHLVSIAPALEFDKEAQAAGVDERLIRLSYAEHGFDDIDGSIGNQLYLKAAAHFMEAHGQKP